MTATRETLLVKVRTGFPASLVAGEGITVSYAAGVYTVALNLAGINDLVTGAVSSTDNAIVRWDGTGGNTLQNSGITVDDSDNISGGAWTGDAVAPAYGGTGVANNAANTLTWSGSFGATFTLTGTTGVTFPTSGTLATTAGTVASLNTATGAISYPLPSPGRVTLTTGTGLTSSDVAGATSIYYNAMGGRYLSVYNGSAWINVDVGTDLTLALDADSGHTGYHQSGKNFDVFEAHVSGSNYYGTGPAWSSDTARGTGAGTTEIEWFQGVPVNKVSMTLRHGSASGNTVTVPARQAVLLGTFRTTANGITEDSRTKRFLSNVFNAMPRPMWVRDATSSWNYSSATVRQANGNTANELQYVQSLPGRPILIECAAPVLNSAGTFRLASAGIGINSTTVASETFRFIANVDNTHVKVARAVYQGFAGLGYQRAVWLEQGGGADTQTWYGENSNGFGGIWTDVIG